MNQNPTAKEILDRYAFEPCSRCNGSWATDSPRVLCSSCASFFRIDGDRLRLLENDAAPRPHPAWICADEKAGRFLNSCTRCTRQWRDDQRWSLCPTCAKEWEVVNGQTVRIGGRS